MVSTIKAGAVDLENRAALFRLKVLSVWIKYLNLHITSSLGFIVAINTEAAVTEGSVATASECFSQP
jgi:hypothetical protein